MAANPVAYAEKTLGVHTVWDDCQHQLIQHDASKIAYLDALKQIRDLKSGITEREAEITSDERGENPDMKITEFKQHVSVTCEKDEIHKGYRQELSRQEEMRDTADADMRHHELSVRAHTARMHELGGLLDFYAAAKEAQSKSTKATETQE